jgi:hypothetical protein
MKKFIYSKKLIYILAVLLVLVFFLPDLIGPLPAALCSIVVIGFALYVYNAWSSSKTSEDQIDPSDTDGNNMG